MPFEGEKFEEISTSPEKELEEELENEKVEEEIEKPPKEIKEEIGKETPEATNEEELGEIQRKIEELKEKELKEREMEELKEEKEKNIETIKKSLKECLPEKFEDLVGNDSKEAWDKRKELFEKEPMYVVASLAGVSSERSREWLDKNKESQKMWWGITRGLIGDDSEKAWHIREFLKVDKRVNRVRGKRLAVLKKILGLHKSEFLFNLRRKIKFPGWYEPGDLVISTTGLDSKKAWELRKEFEEIAPAETLISLAGDNSERAWKIRGKYRGDKKLKWALRKSLAGLGKEREK